MAENSHSSVEKFTRARPVLQLPLKQKSQKTGILLGSLGVSVVPQGPVPNLSTGYPQPNVDNPSGVWEFEGLPRNYYKCANPLTS